MEAKGRYKGRAGRRKEKGSDIILFYLKFIKIVKDFDFLKIN